MHKEKTQIIEAKSCCYNELAACIIALHTIGGCDHNSVFCYLSNKVISDRIHRCKKARDL